MTIKNALSLFNRLAAETTKKSEVRIYKDFIELLTNVEKRSLTSSEIASIETKLDALELTSTTKYKQRHFKNAIQQFKKYLKDTFSLITKGHYTRLGISLGASTGLLIGVVFLPGLARSLGISLGLSVGLLIGLVIASYLESQAKASGNLV